MEFSWAFMCAFFSIILIDLILAGDNAVVIAMAVRSLPEKQRKIGIACGAGAAVLLRVVCTFFVAQLLVMSYVKLVGGVVIAWIAVKLFMEGLPKTGEKEAKTIWQAVKLIIVADISMSIDNMLAVGGACHGNLFLLIFGLGLSVPLVVFTSNLLAKLMDKYPVIIYIGAAVLGKVAGEMIITDPFVVGFFGPNIILQYLAEAVFAISVIVIGKFLAKRSCRNERRSSDQS